MASVPRDVANNADLLEKDVKNRFFYNQSYGYLSSFIFHIYSMHNKHTGITPDHNSVSFGFDRTNAQAFSEKYDVSPGMTIIPIKQDVFNSKIYTLRTNNKYVILKPTLSFTN